MTKLNIEDTINSFVIMRFHVLPAHKWTSEMFPPPPSPVEKIWFKREFILLSQREDKCTIE